MTASDGQREQLAAALISLGDDNDPPEFWPEVVEALLPVVQRIADQRAAQALREAADEWDDDLDLMFDSCSLRDQADALDPS